MGLTQSMSRRQAVRYLGLITAGMATACTPLRIVTGAFSDEFKDDRALVARVLRAFVEAVIPAVPADAPDPVRPFFDPDFPFAPYARFFAADLSRRSFARFGQAKFDRLPVEQRTAVIQEGLAADATTRKLYHGAILLAQVSFYGGIYDDDRGCELIDFPGRYRGDEVSYEDGDRFIPPALTATGNYT